MGSRSVLLTASNLVLDGCDSSSSNISTFSTERELAVTIELSDGGHLVKTYCNEWVLTINFRCELTVIFSVVDFTLFTLPIWMIWKKQNLYPLPETESKFFSYASHSQRSCECNNLQSQLSCCKLKPYKCCVADLIAMSDYFIIQHIWLS
jgi:hypothetical protein